MLVIELADILLDPRTHEPVINENGSLVFIDDPVRIGRQRFNIWINTGINTYMDDPEWGFDIMSILRFPIEGTLGIMRAAEMAMYKCLEDLIVFDGFNVYNVSVDDGEVTIKIKFLWNKSIIDNSLVINR